MSDFPTEMYCKKSNLVGVNILPTILLKTQTTPKDGYEKYILNSKHKAIISDLESRLQIATEALEEIKDFTYRVGPTITMKTADQALQKIKGENK
jgi:hypothetical protein